MANANTRNAARNSNANANTRNARNTNANSNANAYYMHSNGNADTVHPYTSLQDLHSDNILLQRTFTAINYVDDVEVPITLQRCLQEAGDMLSKKGVTSPSLKSLSYTFKAKSDSYVSMWFHGKFKGEAWCGEVTGYVDADEGGWEYFITTSTLPTLSELLKRETVVYYETEGELDNSSFDANTNTFAVPDGDVLDFIEFSEVKIQEYLQNNPESIVIGLATRDREAMTAAAGWSRRQLNSLLRDATKMYHPCGDDGIGIRTDVTLVQVGLSNQNILIRLEDARRVINAKKARVFIVSPTSTMFKRTTSVDSMRYDMVSGHHCQEGTDKVLYDIAPWRPVGTTTGGGTTNQHDMTKVHVPGCGERVVHVRDRKKVVRVRGEWVPLKEALKAPAASRSRAGTRGTRASPCKRP